MKNDPLSLDTLSASAAIAHGPRSARKAWRPLVAAFASLSVLAGLSACGGPDGKGGADSAAETKDATKIAWREGDVNDAFAEASEKGKPILLYWGAVWCPPCNRLKAGLFRDPAFVARTRDFIPVYLDGDSPGAQAWGERFKIKGYPTLIVLRPDLTELTRISGSGDPVEVAAILDAAHNGSANAEELVRRALKEPAKLKSGDWTLLAGYGGWQDAKQFGPPADVLAKLSAAAPTDRLKRQFALQALAQREEDAPPLNAAGQSAAKATLKAVLADAEESRENRSALTSGGADLVQAATVPGTERDQLARALVRALDGYYADEKLSIYDRLSPVGTELALYRIQAGKKAAPPEALAKKIRDRVAWADGAAKNPYERQSLVSTAARLLGDAGDKAGAEKLLKAELAKSEAPYYYMPSLAKLAEERGDKKAAVDWLRQGYEKSEGPASRVQWGVTYVDGLIRLAPSDKAAIEAATGEVIGELASQPQGYRQRTRQRLEELGKQLVKWSAANGGSETLARLRKRTGEACAGQADSKVLSACRNWLGAA